MKKVAQKLTLALLTITVCIALLVGGTFALFTKDIPITNHLQAGNLNATLVRDKLEKNALDLGTGLIKKADPDTEKVDFTKETTRNLFDLNDGDRVAPGCSYAASMVLTNTGSVAFSYWIEFKLNSDKSDSELADQLFVLVTDKDGKMLVAQTLKEGLNLGSESVGLGVVHAQGGTARFTVKVEFVSNNDTNNAAQNKEVSFDFIVHAIQYAEVQG